MTAIKSKQKVEVVLDFSDQKYSKNKIKQQLKNANVINQYEENGITYFNVKNLINVGMYTIRLWLPLDSWASWNRLKDYKDFQISIYEKQNHEWKTISLDKDARFKNQYWIKYNSFGNLRIKHLIDIIMHCQRLNNLKAFL